VVYERRRGGCTRTDALALKFALRRQPNRSVDICRRFDRLDPRCARRLLHPGAAGDGRGPHGGAEMRMRQGPFNRTLPHVGPFPR